MNNSPQGGAFNSPQGSVRPLNADNNRTLAGNKYNQAPAEELGDQKAILKIRDQRRSTDIMCCLVFLVFCVGFLFVAREAILRGDPQRLYHGFDYRGNLCGVSPDVAGMPLMYWPRPDKLHYPICVGHCPGKLTEQVDFPRETIKHESSLDKDGKRVITIIQDLVKIDTYPSKPMGQRFCLPEADGTHAGLFVNFTKSMVKSNLETPLAEVSDRFQDVLNAWAVLAVMLPLAVILGYMYLFWLKHCAKILTWTLILSLITACGVLSYYLLGVLVKDEARSKELLSRYTERPVFAVKVLGYVSTGITVILVLSLFWLCKAINAIIGCVEASCDAIWAMPFLLPVPVLDICLKIVYTIAWSILFSWALSAGEVRVPVAQFDTESLHGFTRNFKYTDEDKFRMGYLIFGYFWGLELMTAVMHFTISYTVAIWYFTPCLPHSDYQKPNVAGHVFFQGMYRAFRYHMGSLALSAFIVALFRVLHGILEVIAKESKATGNPVAASIAHCCMCCVWCFEEVVRFINKNAIIEMVLKSKDFFTSAGSAMKTLAGASAEVAGLNGVTFLFQIMGITSITAMCAGASYLLTTRVNIYAEPTSDYYIESPLIVVVLAGVVGLVVSSAYMFIFDMVSDTLLFCWLTDTEDGVTEFAPKPLRNICGHPVRKAGDKNTPF